MSAVLMGIDLGTTGIKVSLLSENGKVLDSSYREYSLIVLKSGYAEQDPKDWWKALTECTKELKERSTEIFESIEGIGISGQMHTHVYLDSNDVLLGSAITWMDQRSKTIVDKILSFKEISNLVFKETCNNIATTYTAPNLRWVIENEPERWTKTTSILLAKDYIKYLLTGMKVTDFSDAAGTLLFDVAHLQWSDQMLHLFNVDKNKLVDVESSDTIIGKITKYASKETGLLEGTPVVNGCSDNSAAALGAGMVRSGQVALIIGTAGVVSACSDQPLPDPRHRVVCWNYCLPNHWINLGVTQTAGASLNWFKESFDQENDSSDIFQQYEKKIKNVPEGSGGMIFLPYLNGERTPYWDPNAKGVFYGISLSSKKEYFIKSIMEGVSYALRNNIETVETLGITVEEVKAVGGGLKSPIWLSILAKILKRPIQTVPNSDAGNWGNALLCGKALGHFKSLENIEAFNKGILIKEQASEVYEKQYQLFLDLYEALKDMFRRS